MKALILTSTTDIGVKAGVETYSGQLKRVFGKAEIIGVEQAGKSSLEGFSLLREPMRALSVCSYAKRHISETAPDIIITHGMYGWAIDAKEAGRPIINISHGTFAGLADNAIPKASLEYFRTRFAYSHFEKQSAKKASAVVSNSQTTQEMNKKYYGVKSTVIRNFVDTKIFRPIGREKARKKLGLEADRTIGLFVGRQEYQKGFDILEKIAASERETCFISITSPQTICEMPNIKSVAPVSREGPALYYNAADFLVFPSRFEGFGFVIAEALACNTPVVTSNVGIARDIEAEGLHKVFGLDIEEWLRKIKLASQGNKAASAGMARKMFSEARFRKEFLGLAESLL